MTLRIGSLFTGTGALDLAVMDAFDADVLWHSQYEPPDKKGKEDTNQYAARILARHWPETPNLGDITRVDWPAVLAEHGPVDILTGGFPCQDVSSAGKRVGLVPDSRSGLWNHMARAIAVLQPRLVIIENVEGLLSAPAASDMEPCPNCVGDRHPGPLLRACGAVLGDLAGLGFHAEWARVAASEVGAPHQRKRVFVYAWPADADPTNLGHERDRPARGRGHGSADGGVDAADAQGAGRQGRGVRGRSAVNSEPAAPDAHGVESERRGVAGVLGGQAATEPGEGDQRERSGDTVGDRGAEVVEPDCPTCGCPESFHDAGGFCAGPCGGHCADPELGRPDEVAADSCGVLPGVHGELPSGRDSVQRGVRDDAPRCGSSSSDAQGVGRGKGRSEPAGQQGGPDAAERGGATPAHAAGIPGRIVDGDDVRAGRGTNGRQPAARRSAAADSDRSGQREDVLNLRPGQPDLDWGDYGPAIRRWQTVLGRRAPWPTDALGRLSPVFTEWLMGLPDGWVTDTPGLTRSAMLRALGNGVVRQQAIAAIRLLHQRAIEDDQRAAA